MLVLAQLLMLLTRSPVLLDIFLSTDFVLPVQSIASNATIMEPHNVTLEVVQQVLLKLQEVLFVWRVSQDVPIAIPQIQISVLLVETTNS